MPAHASLLTASVTARTRRLADHCVAPDNQPAPSAQMRSNNARRYQIIVQKYRAKVSTMQDVTREALVRDPTKYLLIKKDARTLGISDEQLEENWNSLYDMNGVL